MTDERDEDNGQGTGWVDLAAGVADGAELADTGCGALGCLASATSCLVLLVPVYVFWS